jgi:hypothetical protein
MSRRPSLSRVTAYKPTNVGGAEEVEDELVVLLFYDAREGPHWCQAIAACRTSLLNEEREERWGKGETEREREREREKRRRRKKRRRRDERNQGRCCQRIRRCAFARVRLRELTQGSRQGCQKSTADIRLHAHHQRWHHLTQQYCQRIPRP